MRPLRLRREQTCQGPLVLIDRAHPLQEGAPPELVPVDRLHPQVLLEQRAARLLAACIRSVEGGRAIVPVSGWRSRAEQQAIWDDTRAREGDAFTRQYVALPGCSEHQTGLAIDLGEDVPDLDFIRPSFPDSGACGAFRRAAARYGFLQRYCREKEALTGIAAEPWHFRYVGKEIASYIMANGMTLEEFTEEAQEAVAEFESRGGDVEEQLAYEYSRLNAPPESYVLDELGEDGDAEVSLVF